MADYLALPLHSISNDTWTGIWLLRADMLEMMMRRYSKKRDVYQRDRKEEGKEGP